MNSTKPAATVCLLALTAAFLWRSGPNLPVGAEVDAQPDLVPKIIITEKGGPNNNILDDNRVTEEPSAPAGLIEPERPPVPVISNPSFTPGVINWISMQEAMELGHPIWLHFYTDDCWVCHDLGAMGFTDPEVKRASQAFSCVKVDAKGTIGRHWKIAMVPQDVFIRPETWKYTHKGVSPAPRDFAAYLKTQRAKFKKETQ